MFVGGSGHGSSFAGYAGGSSGAAVVQKHIYVHVPPPEPEEIIPQRTIPVAQAQKHYKIIFIKGMATTNTFLLTLDAVNRIIDFTQNLALHFR